MACVMAAALLIASGAVFLWYAKEKQEAGALVGPEGVTRGEALKSIALALVDREDCLAAEGGYFSEHESEAWYVPYFNYLYRKEIIRTEDIPAVRYAVEQNILTSELKHILYRLNMVETADRYLQAEEEQPVSETLWWEIYEEVLLFYDRGCEVKKQTVKICGTIANVAEAQPWQVYTNRGVMGFDGLALDYYIDSEIEVLQRNGQIIRVTRLLDRDITYENVWIIENGTDEIQVFLYGIVRSFSLQHKGENWKDTVGDVTLQNGTVVRVTGKTETIREKVLAVYEDSIELEHSGRIPLSDQFQAYQLYGQLERKTVEDILVGYDNQAFVLQDQMICSALILQPAQFTQIRVLLETTGYTSYYHASVQVTGQGDLMMTNGNRITRCPAGSIVEIAADDFSGNHIILESEEEIGIVSISRAQGTPYYSGRLELSLTQQGILIVNELPLEEYLLKVVPSEMPARYGLETAKIQAICARSFAIGQIEKNGCREYGAHVDDSTTYQVYNNIPAQDVSTQGVRETEGMVLTENGTVISTWYYSTSWGYGTDLTSWGTSSGCSYIRASAISQSGEMPDLQNEETFRSQMLNWDGNNGSESDGYESDETWFRWKYAISIEQLQAELQSALPQVMASYGKNVLTVDEMGNERRAESSDFGDLIAMEVAARGPGGIVSELLIRGTKQTLRIRYQTAIRQLLGRSGRTYENKSSAGSSVVEKSILPSAFFCLIPTESEAGNVVGYTVFGGGNGHGIGMSQNAAKAMTDQGMSAEQVLQFFYPGTSVTRDYGLVSDGT